jgi:curved DNA-binding protein CbpA
MKIISEFEELSEFENTNENENENEKEQNNFTSSLFPDINLPYSLNSSNLSFFPNSNINQSIYSTILPQSFKNKTIYPYYHQKSQQEYLEEIEEKKRYEENMNRYLLSSESIIKLISESIGSPMLNAIYFGV